jgi:hypothetical protein
MPEPNLGRPSEQDTPLRGTARAGEARDRIRAIDLAHEESGPSRIGMLA